MGVWKLLRLRPSTPSSFGATRRHSCKKRPSFQRVRGYRYALDPKAKGRIPGSSPVKTEILNRFRSKEYGKPYLRSVSKSLALLLLELPRCQNPEIKRHGAVNETAGMWDTCLQRPPPAGYCQSQTTRSTASWHITAELNIINSTVNNTERP